MMQGGGEQSRTTAGLPTYNLSDFRTIRSDEWKRDLADNAWAEYFRGSGETRKHLEAEHEVLARMLAELGMVTRQSAASQVE